MASPLYDQSLSGRAQGIPQELTSLDPWSADNPAETEKGRLLKADTPEELAELIRQDGADNSFDFDNETFLQTFNDYNAYCENGLDEEFDSSNLAALSTPPYYAIKLQPVLYTTCGGPRKNATSHVVDLDGNPIPGSTQPVSRAAARAIFTASTAATGATS